MHDALFEAQIQDTVRRFEECKAQRERRQAALESIEEPGRWREIDDPARFAQRLRRVGRTDVLESLLRDDRPPGAPATRAAESATLLERIIGESQLIGSYFLVRGSEARSRVARVIVRRSGFGFGTGFLVGPNLFMTNNHVLPTRASARRAAAEFDFVRTPPGVVWPNHVHHFDPSRLFITDRRLDYTVVFVETTSTDGDSLEHRGWMRLLGESGKALVGDRVNIIQHPGGRPQELALRNNEIVDVVDDFLHYETDTEPGTSGSPVSSDTWDLAALHHSGVPDRNARGQILLNNGDVWDGRRDTAHLIKWIANEGVRISSIVRDLRAKIAGPESSGRDFVEAAFKDPALQPVDPASRTPDGATTHVRTSPDGTTFVTVPVHVAVGLRSLTDTAAPDARVGTPATPRTGDDPADVEADTAVEAALERLAMFADRPYYDEDADFAALDEYYAPLPIEATREEWFDLFHEHLRTTHETVLSYRRARLDFLYPFVDLRLRDDGTRDLQSVYSELRFEPSTLITNEVLMELRLEEALRATGIDPGQAEESMEPGLLELEAQFPFNCEHVVPQSWFRRRQPMKADLHHLFTCESDCNSFRSNIPYFDFDFFQVQERVRSNCGRREANQFEPGAGKGAVARATLYFLLRYPGQIGDRASELSTSREDVIDMLLTWHEDEPADIYEWHRNAAIHEVQGNRNPLVDYPDMARGIAFERGFG